MRPLRFLRSATACAVALFALGGMRASGADTIIHVGVGTDSITMTPFYLADQMGFFKAEGLTVEFVPLPSATLMYAPLGTGQLDVGGGAVAPGIYNSVARGIDLRIVADLGSDPPGYGFQTLVIRKSLLASGGYKSLQDLRGKSLAITARGTAIVGALLRKAGLTLNDVKMVYMPVADQITAMKNGSLDASLMPEPGPSIAEKEGVGTKVMHDDEFYPNQNLVAMFYGTNFLKHRDLGLKFMRAYLKAVRLYNDNLKGSHIVGKQADVIMTVFAQATKQDRSVLNAITPNGNNPDGQLNMPAMRNDLQYFKDQGLIDTPSVQADDAIDLSFANEAVKSLGPYRR